MKYSAAHLKLQKWKNRRYFFNRRKPASASAASLANHGTPNSHHSRNTPPTTNPKTENTPLATALAAAPAIVIGSPPPASRLSKLIATGTSHAHGNSALASRPNRETQNIIAKMYTAAAQYAPVTASVLCKIVGPSAVRATAAAPSHNPNATANPSHRLRRIPLAPKATDAKKLSSESTKGKTSVNMPAPIAIHSDESPRR